MFTIKTINDFKNVVNNMYNNEEVKYLLSVYDTVKLLKDKGYSIELDTDKNWRELDDIIQANNSTMDSEKYRKFDKFMQENIFGRGADVFYCDHPYFEDGVDGTVFRVDDYMAWKNKLVNGKITVEMVVYTFSSKMYNGDEEGFSIIKKKHIIYPSKLVWYNEETGEFQFTKLFKRVSPNEYTKLQRMMIDAHEQIDHITYGWYDNLPIEYCLDVEEEEEVNVSSRSSEREN